MLKRFAALAPILAALSLAACDGNTSETPAETSSADDGPQVGDYVPESGGKREPNPDGVTEIGWEDLMPEGEEERQAELYQQQMAEFYANSGPIQEGSAADEMVQFGSYNTVSAYDGAEIRIPGYTVPFDFGADAKVTEFLLVPYYGACIHAPPPPPNQTIYVSMETPIMLKDLQQAVWINGTIHARTQKSELADAAYTIKARKVEEYAY